MVNCTMRYATVKDYARKMRREPTPAEAAFWEVVRGRRINGFKFGRQYVIQHDTVNNLKKYYIADFYCAAERLIVELDGPIHAQQLEYDQIRTAKLEQLGFRVIRFTNHQVLHRISEVRSLLYQQLKMIAPTNPPPTKKSDIN